MLKAFWTMYQQPLCQAAYICGGVEQKAIPARPAKTPARQVWSIGEWENKLLVGRRNSVEMWDPATMTLERQVYHRWLYTLHVSEIYNGLLLVGCAGLDVALLLDWDGNVHWEWWAWEDGYAQKPDALEQPDWVTTQLTQQWQPDSSCHLNSINVEPNGELLITLMKAKKVVRVSTAKSHPKSSVEFDADDSKYKHIHDFKYDDVHGKRAPVFGCENGLWLDGQRLLTDTWPWIKRIRRLPDGSYAVTSYAGVGVCTPTGRIVTAYKVPVPFGIAHPVFS